MRRFRMSRGADERGVSAIEYAIIAAAIALVIITVISSVGGRLSDVIGSIPGQISATPSTPSDEYCNGSTPTTVEAYIVEDFGDGNAKASGPSDAVFWASDGTVSPWTGQVSTAAVDRFWLVYTPDDAASFGLPTGYTGTTSESLRVFIGSGDVSACDSGSSGGGGISDCGSNYDSSGNYIGSTDDWYWIKTETYTLSDGTYIGEVRTDASGSVWDSVSTDATYGLDQRGASLGAGYSYDYAWAWYPLQGSPYRPDGSDGNTTVHGTRYDFENGWFFVPADKGVFVFSTMTLQQQMDYWGTNESATYTVASWWHGNTITYQQSDGILAGTTWDGSPTDNGGVQLAAAPEASDTVTVNLPTCGGPKG